MSLHKVLQATVGPGFQIDRELPGAGMSRVFLAREPSLARDVVVKVLPPDLASSSSQERFAREIQLTAGLQHPHILPVISAGGNEELRFYITPFIRGESLKHRLASGTPMPVGDAIRAADDLLNAIAFAHARGVIHRDIKPGNILLSEDHAILADFGIAALVERDEPTELGDQMTGSTLDSGPIYIAPEKPRDERRDLFAAAVVIHEMLTGAPGFAGVSASAVTSAIRDRHPDAADESRKLGAVISRALAVDPAQRFATAQAFRAQLRPMRGSSRPHLLLGIGAGSIAAAIALAAFALRPSPAAIPEAAPPSRPVISLADTSITSQQGETADNGEVVNPVTPVDTAPARTPPPPMRAVDSASLLFKQGDLGAAATLYQLAIQEDAADSRAQLGAAFTSGIMNSPADQESSRTAAERALEGKPALDAHDRAIAEGLIALAGKDFPEACVAFERARAARASFEAFFGLGECRLRDEMIVFGPDGTPMFRAGLATAFDAFAASMRAAAPTPPGIGYRRLAHTVPQTSAEIRMGRSADGRLFTGHWRVFGDTLGFVVSPSGAPRVISPEIFAAAGEAANLGREMLRPMYLSWIKLKPDDAMAHEMFAVMLENSGAIAAVGHDRVSALTAIGRARALERNPTNALRLATIHARLLLRAREFELLARLADSLLTAHVLQPDQVMEPVMPLAILTGRVEQATAMLARLSGTAGRSIRGLDGRPLELPASLVSSRAEFLVRASLGICDDRVRAAPKRLTELLDATFPNGVPRGLEASFLERTVTMALPCLGASVVKTLREPGRSLQQWARAYDPADTAFAADFAARSLNRPASASNAGAEMAVDAAMPEVMTRIALGDSAGALRTLKLSLDRLPIVGRGLLVSEFSVGATVRAMALTAELAAALGDRETAQRWSTAVVALWEKADPELHPQRERLRAIAKATSGGR